MFSRPASHEADFKLLVFVQCIAFLATGIFPVESVETGPPGSFSFMHEGLEFWYSVLPRADNRSH